MRTGRPSEPIEPGKRIGMLTTVKVNGRDEHGRITWECICDCGNTSTVKATYLRTGETKSCGCQKRAGNRRTHGHSGKRSQAYRAWKNMRTRATNPNIRQAKDYSGRGISCDPRWESFENFLADMGEPLPGQSLDRINNDGNYEKSNCRWTGRVTQRRNSRAAVHWVNINGERLNLKDAVAKYGQTTYANVASRIHRGWDDIEAIVTPKTHRFRRGK